MIRRPERKIRRGRYPGRARNRAPGSHPVELFRRSTIPAGANRGANSVAGPPLQTIGFPAIPLGGATGPAVTLWKGGEDFPRRRGWTAVDQALGGDRSTDPFGDHPFHDDDPLDPRAANADLVTRPHRLSRFGCRTIDTYMTPATRSRGSRSRLEQPHGPYPRVDPDLSRTVIRNSGSWTHPQAMRRAVTTSSADRLV